MKKLLASAIATLAAAASFAVVPAVAPAASADVPGSFPAIQGAAAYQDTDVLSSGLSVIQLDVHGTPAQSDGPVRHVNQATLRYWIGETDCVNTNTDATEGRITGRITDTNLNPLGTPLYFTVTYHATALTGNVLLVNKIAVNHRFRKPYSCTLARVPLHNVVAGAIFVQTGP